MIWKLSSLTIRISPIEQGLDHDASDALASAGVHSVRVHDSSKDRVY